MLKDAMSKITVDSIGVLTDSYKSADTTAGITEVMNFGLSTALFDNNAKQMEEYNSALSVMKNLKVIDILNGIIDGFNTQLKEANKNVYDAVESNLAWSDPYSEAPFSRDKKSNRWIIEVCVESNLTGDKYKTRKFADYESYKNTTVFLKPIKVLDGGEIDFTQATSYSKIDSDELRIYVDLESEWLNRDIDKVFGEDGLFGKHQTEEFERISEKFGKYYGDWVAGEALKDGAFYSKPMFPNGPNMLQTAAIAASLSGQPWLAVAISAATSMIQVADGTMSWKQAAFQVGVSVATSAIGVGASELGSLAGSAGSLANAAVKSTTMAVGNTLLSGVSLEGGGLGYDKDKMTNWKTWASAGVTAAAGTLTGGIKMGGMSSAAVSAVGSGLSQGITTGDWKGSMKNAAISGAASYLTGKAGFESKAMQNASSMMFRKMLGSDEQMSWATVANTDPIGEMASKMIGDFFVSEETKAARKAEDDARKKQQENATTQAGMLGWLEESLGGMYTSMRNRVTNFATGIKNDFNGLVSDVTKLGNGIKELGKTIGKTLVNFGQSVKNKVVFGVYGTNDNMEVKRAKAINRFDDLVEDGQIKKNSLVYYDTKAALGIPLTEKEILMQAVLAEEDKYGDFRNSDNADENPELLMAGKKGRNNPDPITKMTYRLSARPNNAIDAYGPTAGRPGKALGVYGQFTNAYDFIELVNSENYIRHQREQSVTDIFIDNLNSDTQNLGENEMLKKVMSSKIPEIVQNPKVNGDGIPIGSNYGLKPGETLENQLNSRQDTELRKHTINLVNSFYGGEKKLIEYYNTTSHGIFENQKRPSDSYSSINSRQIKTLLHLQRKRRIKNQ